MLAPSDNTFSNSFLAAEGRGGGDFLPLAAALILDGTGGGTPFFFSEAPPFAFEARIGGGPRFAFAAGIGGGTGLPFAVGIGGGPRFAFAAGIGGGRAFDL